MKHLRLAALALSIATLACGEAGQAAPGAETKAGFVDWSFPVLCYHRFGPEKEKDGYQISAERFEEQLAWMRSAGFRSVTLTQTAKALTGEKPQGWPEKPVMISIDDGYRNSWTVAGPLLKKYGFSAVYFITTDMTGTGGTWLSFKDLKEMRRQGFDVASHSRSHPNLAKPKKDESPAGYKARIMDELAGSKAKLEKGLGEKITAIAYPYGAYNRAIEPWIKQAGYSLGFSVTKGQVTAGSKPFRLRRYLLMGHPSLKAFKRLVLTKPAGPNQVLEGALFVRGNTPTVVPFDQNAFTGKFRVYSGSKDLAVSTEKGHFEFPPSLKPGFHLLKFMAQHDGEKFESHSLIQVIRPSWKPHFNLENE